LPIFDWRLLISLRSIQQSEIGNHFVSL
jgi:hypothetical protein